MAGLISSASVAELLDTVLMPVFQAIPNPKNPKAKENAKRN